MISNLDRLDEFTGAATIRIHRPMVDVLTASAALDLDPGKITVLVEEGKIRWAWNIACPVAGRRTIRILTKSLEEYQTGRRARYENEAEEFRAVMKFIFSNVVCKPGVMAMVRVCDLAQRLMVDGQTISRLLTAKEFEVGKPALARSGVNASPQIKVASVEAFLKARRLT